MQNTRASPEFLTLPQVILTSIPIPIPLWKLPYARSSIATAKPLRRRRRKDAVLTLRHRRGDAPGRKDYGHAVKE